MASLLANADYAFRRTIANIAKQSGESAEAVFAKWSEYCRLCSLYDQSPVIFEFCNWYGYQDPRKDGEF